ncbi:hypothetical protein [Streptomyces bungoensis]|uniref:hypothetical protein n=1 Tax=Streptomyces bungoensis TaxID=285568 RepID=UPI000AF88492|nr:hypothetical protein [Streptomyces bungoensis]
MAEDDDGTARGSAGPAGPFLREYAPNGMPPQVSAQRASVLFYRNGGHSVITVSGARHVDKRALARPYTVCEIAQGTFVSPLRLDLPAAGGTSFFKAEVDIEWEVTDPHLAAVQVVTDVAARLTSPVLERLREVTLTYRVTDAEQANRVITRECAGGRWSDLGADLGLRVRLYVRLGVDDEAIEYARKTRGAHADAQVTRVRQDHFQRMLLGGELEQLSFMLAADPEGAKDFLEKIRQEGREDEKERVDRLYGMAVRGELHSVDVETQVLNLLNQDRRRPIQGPIGAVPARREPRELEPAADGPYTPDWVSDAPPRRDEARRRDRRYDDDLDREDPRGRTHRPDAYADDLGDDFADDGPDREPPGYRTSRPARVVDPDGEPARGRTPWSGRDPADDTGHAPPRRRGYDPADGPGEPARGRTHRPGSRLPDDDGPQPVDDLGWGASRRRTYRPEAYPPEPYPAGDDPHREGTRGRGYPPADDPDAEPPRGRAHRPEPYPPEDDPGRAPRRGRRRPRDDGWSWAEEDR